MTGYCNPHSNDSEALYYLEGTAAYGESDYKSMEGQKLTSSQMRDAGCFEGFDFTDTWIIDTRSEYRYLQLRSNPQFSLNLYQLEYAEISFDRESYCYNGLEKTRAADQFEAHSRSNAWMQFNFWQDICRHVS